MILRFLHGLVLAVLTVLATGCATVEPHLVPAPTIFKDDRLAFEKTVPAELAIDATAGFLRHYTSSDRRSGALRQRFCADDVRRRASAAG